MRRSYACDRVTVGIAPHQESSSQTRRGCERGAVVAEIAEKIGPGQRSRAMDSVDVFKGRPIC